MRTTIQLLVGVVLGVTCAACAKQEPTPEKIAPVEVAPVVRGSIRDIVTADAVLIEGIFYGGGTSRRSFAIARESTNFFFGESGAAHREYWAQTSFRRLSERLRVECRVSSLSCDWRE